MSDAFRAGFYHAETGRPSNLAIYTRGTFAWYDYLEGQAAGFNERYWYHVRVTENLIMAEEFKAKRDAVKALRLS